MPGQPKWNELLVKMQREEREEWLLVQIASGRSLRACAQEIGIGRPYLWRWVNLTKERRAKYDVARIEAGSAMAEEALEIIDNASTLSAQDITKAKAQVDTRRWLSGIADREQFGEVKADGLSLTINGLHLDALIKLGSPQSQRVIASPKTEPIEAETIEAEVIEEHMGQS